MLYANVNGVKSRAQPNITGLCPVCDSEVISKCGEINMWHFAHKSLTDCDAWNEGETSWHREWKSLFPSEWAEVTVEDNGIKHRADIYLPNGYTVEFQHSPISSDEIASRESFYKNMIWIFDISDCVDRFLIRHKENYSTFRWKYPRKHIACAKSQVYLDLGDMVFKLKKMYYGTPCGGWGYIDTKDNFILSVKSSIEQLQI